MNTTSVSERSRSNGEEFSLSGNRILFISDTHTGPDGFNGVQRTMERSKKVLQQWGNQVFVFQTNEKRSFSVPGHPEVRLSVALPSHFRQVFQTFRPTHIHIFTEGPIGVLGRWMCKKHGMPYTTSYHTQWVDFFAKNHPLLSKLLPDGGWPFIRFCHSRAKRVMTRTESIRQILLEKGFSNVVLWPGGVDTEVFMPCDPIVWSNLVDVDGKPVDITPQERTMLYVGRISKEKNLRALLSLNIENTRAVLVGSGPDLRSLQRDFPRGVFLGVKSPEELPPLYSSATLFVHPGKHETFCLGAAEALVCDTPVAAFTSTGLVNLIDHERLGVLDDEDLEKAVRAAFELPPSNGFCAQYARERYGTEVVTRQFFKNCVPTSL